MSVDLPLGSQASASNLSISQLHSSVLNNGRRKLLTLNSIKQRSIQIQNKVFQKLKFQK